MSSARLPPGCAPPSFHSGLLPRRRLPHTQTGLTSSGEAAPPLDLSWGRDCVKCLRPPQAAALQPAAPESNPEQTDDNPPFRLPADPPCHRIHPPVHRSRLPRRAPPCKVTP